MELRTERLVLRPLCAQDLETCDQYALDADNCRYMLFLPNQTSEETLAFLKSCEAEWDREVMEAFEFAITLEGRHIGAVSLFREEECLNLELMLTRLQHPGSSIQ